jgi:hypothetical protein
MINICTILWSPNESSASFSHYTEEHVEKLYRGFRRNLTIPWTFHVWTDYPRMLYGVEALQHPITRDPPDYRDCLQLYELDEPSIQVGLDTVITGNIDHLAQWCLAEPAGSPVALPRDPFHWSRACTGVQLVPQGHAGIWNPDKITNDMEHMRAQPHRFIDDLFPGQVQSWKCAVKLNGQLDDTRICYFHGDQKMGQVTEPWMTEHWV